MLVLTIYHNVFCSRLSHLLEEGNDDVKIEAAVILGSIAKGSKQCVIELISENFVAKLLKSE